MPSGPVSEREIIDRMASRLFVRAMTDPSQKTWDEVATWLRASPRHAVAYAAISYAWERSAILADGLPS